MGIGVTHPKNIVLKMKYMALEGYVLISSRH